MTLFIGTRSFILKKEKHTYEQTRHLTKCITGKEEPKLLQCSTSNLLLLNNSLAFLADWQKRLNNIVWIVYGVDFYITSSKFLPVIFLRETLWSFIGDW